MLWAAGVLWAVGLLWAVAERLLRLPAALQLAPKWRALNLLVPYPCGPLLQCVAGDTQHDECKSA